MRYAHRRNKYGTFQKANSILRNDGEIEGMGGIEGIGGIEGMGGMEGIEGMREIGGMGGMKFDFFIRQVQNTGHPGHTDQIESKGFLG